MRKWVVLLAVLVLVLVLRPYFFKPRGASLGNPQPSAESQDATVAGALARQDTNTVGIIQSNFARVQAAQPAPAASPAPAGVPAPLQFTNFPPSIALENMGRAVRQYGEMFGGNPVGTNQEITRQLGGANPRHINFINIEAGMRVNDNGELIDAWGTPYFFHQLSGSDMEIHSAGPDRIMWTADDLVSH